MTTMQRATHTCPAPGCRATVPHRQLACRPHWYSIPKPMRDRIWSAWDDGQGAGSAEHHRAISDAIEWLRVRYG